MKIYSMMDEDEVKALQQEAEDLRWMLERTCGRGCSHEGCKNLSEAEWEKGERLWKMYGLKVK